MFVTEVFFELIAGVIGLVMTVAGDLIGKLLSSLLGIPG
jgi:hypothetical protein